MNQNFKKFSNKWMPWLEQVIDSEDHMYLILDMYKERDNQMTFKELLKSGRDDLLEFKRTGNPGENGIEDSLTGKYFDQILELNNYIYTTASTNYPYDDTFQPMFLEFYIMRSNALKLINQIRGNKQYNFIMCDYSKNEYEYQFMPSCEDCLITEDMIKSLAHSDLSDNIFPRVYSLLRDEHNPIVQMTIEDINMKDRTLYDKILKFLI